MVTAKKYIESGAIEACILGLADEKDLALLQQMEEMYPEVKEARKTLEKKLSATNKLTLPTPAQTQVKLMEALQREAKESGNQPSAFTNQVDDGETDIEKIRIQLRWSRRLLIVASALFVGSAVLSLFLYRSADHFKIRNTELLLQQNALVAKKNALDATVAVIKNPFNKQVALHSTAKEALTVATVFWDTNTKDVYLFNNQLPAPANGKQYQLWAMVDGKLQSAGILSWQEDGTVAKMSNVPHAESFAISLEQEGGSSEPNPNTLIAIGK